MSFWVFWNLGILNRVPERLIRICQDRAGESWRYNQHASVLKWEQRAAEVQKLI